MRWPSRDVGWCTPLCLDICILSFNSLQLCGNSYTDNVLDFPETIRIILVPYYQLQYVER